MNVTKGNPPGPFDLDGREVPIITAYLFHAGGHENPAVLRANASKSFKGVEVNGMGFTFDDTDTKGVANPLSLMHELITKDQRNAERIFPYLGGEEVNDDPRQQHHRYTINFAEFPLRRAELGSTWVKSDERQREHWLRSGIVPLDYPYPVASDWPDLIHVLEEKVKPEREKGRGRVEAERLAGGWWLFNRSRPELFDALARMRGCVPPN